MVPGFPGRRTTTPCCETSARCPASFNAPHMDHRVTLACSGRRRRFRACPHRSAPGTPYPSLHPAAAAEACPKKKKTERELEGQRPGRQLEPREEHAPPAFASSLRTWALERGSGPFSPRAFALCAAARERGPWNRRGPRTVPVAPRDRAPAEITSCAKCPLRIAAGRCTYPRRPRPHGALDFARPAPKSCQMPSAPAAQPGAPGGEPTVASGTRRSRTSCYAHESRVRRAHALAPRTIRVSLPAERPSRPRAPKGPGATAGRGPVERELAPPGARTRRCVAPPHARRAGLQGAP